MYHKTRWLYIPTLPMDKFY